MYELYLLTLAKKVFKNNEMTKKQPQFEMKWSKIVWLKFQKSRIHVEAFWYTRKLTVASTSKTWGTNPISEALKVGAILV